jgi:hypothetical protein
MTYNKEQSKEIKLDLNLPVDWLLIRDNDMNRRVLYGVRILPFCHIGVLTIK